MRRTCLVAILCVCALPSAPARAQTLPDAYFRAMSDGVEKVQARLAVEPGLDLRGVEEKVGWRHFPHAMLAPALLYLRRNPANRHYQDPSMLALALRIGDLAADADERGLYYWRLDSYWDTYMWLEAYGLLKPKLGAPRRSRWRACLERNVAMVAARCAEWHDFPSYTESFIGTSTNHFALWALNLVIAGQLFQNREWETLGRHILHRLATSEQAPDGYWGEDSPAGPTNGYDLLTLAAVGVYWEYTHDPDALTALRRATAFHEYFTYPDGQPVEVLNDRNRHWDLSIYGNFAFTRSAGGRRFAQFLFSHFPPSRLDMEALGRIAQNALYYHAGPLAPIPQDLPHYHHRLAGPAGIRKNGPWVVCLSGLIAPRLPLSQWFLDRQSNLSVFHTKTGLIITGANSHGQPELATFSETILGVEYFLPVTSRLRMTDAADFLWLAFNSFFVRMEVPPPGPTGLELQFFFTGRGDAPERARLALQLCLKAGETLETGAGLQIKLGTEKIHLPPAQIRGLIRHNGWTIKTTQDASLVWPLFPYDPYRNGPSTRLDQAVGVLSIPLRLTPEKDRFVRPDEQVISVRVRVP